MIQNYLKNRNEGSDGLAVGDSVLRFPIGSKLQLERVTKRGRGIRDMKG